MIAISCPRCLKMFDLPDEAAGKSATCPCGHRFKLPEPISEIEFQEVPESVYVPESESSDLPKDHPIVRAGVTFFTGIAYLAVGVLLLALAAGLSMLPINFLVACLILVGIAIWGKLNDLTKQKT